MSLVKILALSLYVEKILPIYFTNMIKLEGPDIYDGGFRNIIKRRKRTIRRKK